MQEANLRNTDFSEADLRESVLLAADLRGANLTKSLLLGAHFEGANLKEVQGLEWDQLEGAHTDKGTQLPGKNVEQPNQQEVVSDVYRSLLNLKKTTSGKDAVEERYAFELHGALKRLEEAGHDVSGLQIPEGALSQGITSFDYTTGGRLRNRSLPPSGRLTFFTRSSTTSSSSSTSVETRIPLLSRNESRKRQGLASKMGRNLARSAPSY